MSVYELKLAKMGTKKAEIRPSATERPYGLRPKKISQKSIDSCCKQAKQIAKFNVTFFHLRTHSGI